ncbi:hypothetical protein Tsubulata_032141 [Turnera subulata]|uniref:Uncharacterized protein n=1 Tax=Turnera subulata TaxID=218843 RepID=A0A9Q0IYN2_9ROSI|nr:hypothetical protein Tsubulata_032141 [Turnera subulata]
MGHHFGTSMRSLLETTLWRWARLGLCFGISMRSLLGTTPRGLCRDPLHRLSISGTSRPLFWTLKDPCWKPLHGNTTLTTALNSGKVMAKRGVRWQRASTRRLLYTMAASASGATVMAKFPSSFMVHASPSSHAGAVRVRNERWRLLFQQTRIRGLVLEFGADPDRPVSDLTRTIRVWLLNSSEQLSSPQQRPRRLLLQLCRRTGDGCGNNGLSSLRSISADLNRSNPVDPATLESEFNGEIHSFTEI